MAWRRRTLRRTTSSKARKQFIMNTIAMIVIGFAAGFLGGMFGVGGGVLMVPALLFIFQERIPSVHVAVGTSMAVIVATSIAGTVQHALSGRVEWGIVAPLAVFAAVGGMFGAYVSGLVEKA
ncbi:sulfite exporter TauE/SafE family protein, partial [Candidatus Sumerlaeota bacterium]|nr:sulfite exporter TauE/SafE family protein [Candidatus Sumerlaeota bacterium]